MAFLLFWLKHLFFPSRLYFKKVRNWKSLLAYLFCLFLSTLSVFSLESRCPIRYTGRDKIFLPCAGSACTETEET